jgi:hypothetical protein
VGMKTIRTGKQGFVLAVSLILVLIIFILMAAICNWAMCEKRFAVTDLNTKKAGYLAEAALEVAFNKYSASNYTGLTHDSANAPLTSTDPKLLPSNGLSNVMRIYDASSAYDGWYKWKWDPGDAHQNFNGSGIPEAYYYRVYPAGTNTTNIEGIGIYGRENRPGTIAKRLRLQVSLDTTFKYVYFSNLNLSEFTRGANQDIDGLIHANGNIYFRPSGSTLNVRSDSITCSGKMIRYQDAWGRGDGGGTVRLSKNNHGGALTTMDGKDQGKNGKGNAFDSDNPNWTKNNGNGARSKWGGVVKDALLGATKISPPSIESFETGGYYDTHAGAHVTPTIADPTPHPAGLSKKTFFNRAEARSETVVEIDMATYAKPANGIIYCSTPVRITNAAKLTRPLTIVSTCNIYTQGDFNKVYGDAASKANGTVTKQPAALMTTSRVYHLSSGWSDAAHDDLTDTVTAGSDPKLYNSDDNNVIEINSCIVDGAPTVDELNYVQSCEGVTNDYYNPTDRDGQPVTSPGGHCWANSDDLLENLGSLTLRKRGSLVHLENAKMCHVKNSSKGWNVNDDYGPGKLAWTVNTSYGAPTRDYAFDDIYSDALQQPPSAPITGTKEYISEF